MPSERQPSSRFVPGRWLYVVPVLLLVAAGWTALAQRAGSSVRPNNAAEAAGIEPATDQFDPKRFRVVGPNLIEDTATGVRRTVTINPGEDIPERFTENVPVNDNLVDDRRYGIGPRPVRVRMASIGLNAEAIPIGLDANRAIAVPRRADITGWWSGGYVPGESGPTVIVGHFDSKVAPGVFANLPSAKVGQMIVIDQSDGSRVLYRVVEVEKLKKSAFPTDKVYGPTDGSTLRLVTCGGKFDRSTGHYVDNLIVYAEMVPMTPGRGLIEGYEEPEYFPTTTTTSTTLVSDTTTVDSSVADTLTPDTVAVSRLPTGITTTVVAAPTSSITPVAAASTVAATTTPPTQTPTSAAESSTTTTLTPGGDPSTTAPQVPAAAFESTNPTPTP